MCVDVVKDTETINMSKKYNQWYAMRKNLQDRVNGKEQRIKFLLEKRASLNRRILNSVILWKIKKRPYKKVLHLIQKKEPVKLHKVCY